MVAKPYPDKHTPSSNASQLPPEPRVNVPMLSSASSAPMHGSLLASPRCTYYDCLGLLVLVLLTTLIFLSEGLLPAEQKPGGPSRPDLVKALLHAHRYFFSVNASLVANRGHTEGLGEASESSSGNEDPVSSLDSELGNSGDANFKQDDSGDDSGGDGTPMNLTVAPGLVNRNSATEEPGNSVAFHGRSDSEPTLGHSKQEPPTNSAEEVSSRAPEQHLTANFAPLEVLPVVQIAHDKPSKEQCRNSGGESPLLVSLAQARKQNAVVYLIGPPGCRDEAERIGVVFEPLKKYSGITRRPQPVKTMARWLILQQFMAVRKLTRVFYMESDVLLFANITDFANRFLPSAPVALPVKRPSFSPEDLTRLQALAVSGHVALWTYDGLYDFLSFVHQFFKRPVLIAAKRGKKIPKIDDSLLLGWYAHRGCWAERNRTEKHCYGDWRAFKMRKRLKLQSVAFEAAFKVRSLSAPFWCRKTPYVDAGWCLFDYNFSLESSSNFKFCSKSQKCPKSMHYAYFRAWLKSRQTSPVQFLAVHFQDRSMLMMDKKDPCYSWGSSKD